jgi:carboxyl-terminal processing protease
VILDLRFNTGGSGLATRLALGEFYPGLFKDSIGNAGVWIDRDDGKQTFSATSLFSAGYEGRLAILVDHATRSAAEVFARVLQYRKRAVVIGRTTAGAVIAAERYSLPDGGSLTVPVRDYLDPSGERLEGRGVRPDVPVSPTLAEVRSGDPDLRQARQVLATR